MPETEGESQTQDKQQDAEKGDDQKQIVMTPSQLAERLERAKPTDYEDLKAKATKLDEIEQANKSELERLSEDLQGYKKRGDTAEQQVARLEVALAKGLTATQAKRLVGSTREEFEADADELLADLGKNGRQHPKPNPAQGQDQGSTSSGDWLRDQLARR